MSSDCDMSESKQNLKERTEEKQTLTSLSGVDLVELPKADIHHLLLQTGEHINVNCSSDVLTYV